MENEAKLRLFVEFTNARRCDEYNEHVPNYHHALNCGRCLKFTLKARHNRVLAALLRTLKDHGIYSTTTLSEIFKSGKDIGPDALVHGAETYAIDVHVNYQGPLSDSYTTRRTAIHKHNKYADFAEITEWPVHSIAFSALGVPTAGVTTFLRSLSNSATKGIVTRALATTAIAVAKGNYAMIHIQEASQALVIPDDE